MFKNLMICRKSIALVTVRGKHWKLWGRVWERLSLRSFVCLLNFDHRYIILKLMYCSIPNNSILQEMYPTEILVYVLAKLLVK